MKFAHLADCHIGSWRDPKLKDISTTAFLSAIDTCIKEQVDFVIIAGDLFNTSFPRLDNLKTVVAKLKELKDKDIAVYIVPGSHDYSPSGRTMLDVLEEAGLFINVFKGEVRDGTLHLKFTQDKKTGAKLTGILGKRGTLEKQYYEHLSREELEQEEGYKIFVFHSGLHEFKPADQQKVDMQPLSLLPKKFDYYAGGHVHMVFAKQEPEYGMITYPGPLFPNSFSELEHLKKGGFYIVENSKPTWYPIQVHNVHTLSVNAKHKTPDVVTQELLDKINPHEFVNTIVLMRIFGALESGKPSDIDMKRVFHECYQKAAYFVMKNTAQLTSKEFDEVKIDAHSVDSIEEKLIEQHLNQIPISEVSDQRAHITALMNALSLDKQEGETRADYQKRLLDRAKLVVKH